MWVLESAHRLSRSLFFGGEEDPASAAGGVQEVPEQHGHGEHGETHGPQHTDEHSAQQEAVLGPQPEEHVIQQRQEAKEPAGESDQERVEEPAAGLVPGQDHLQAPLDPRGLSGRERESGRGSRLGSAAPSDSTFDVAPVIVDQDVVATVQAHQDGSLPRGSGTLPDNPVGPDGSPLAHASLRERGESEPHEGAGRTRSGLALQPDGSDGPDTRRQVAHLHWPPLAPPPPPPLPPTPPSSARPSVSAMTWPPPAGSSEDADEAEQGTSTRYATDGSDDERDESEGGSESGGGGLDDGPEDILDGGHEDTLLPPRRAGVGTSRVSALRQVLLAQASPFALRAAMWRAPEVEPLLDQSAREGLGEGPNADADNRADKAVQIDGAVPPRERHPQLIEDLKAFLGEKGHTKQVQPEEPSHLASPFHAKSPEQALRTVAEAMSSHDGGGQGLELRGLGHLGHGSAGPTGDSSAATTAECAPHAAIAATATSSRGDGQADYRRRSVCSTHGHTSGASGATSMEDKCLECCVYYGVMCCQCSIL